MNKILNAVFSYLESGLSIIPTDESKHPRLKAWAQYQSQRPTEAEVRRWFSQNGVGIAVVGGAVSGNFEPPDFDCAGEAFPAYATAVDEQVHGLIDRIMQETSINLGVPL